MHTVWLKGCRAVMAVKIIAEVQEIVASARESVCVCVCVCLCKRDDIDDDDSGRMEHDAKRDEVRK